MMSRLKVGDPNLPSLGGLQHSLELPEGRIVEAGLQALSRHLRANRERLVATRVVKDGARLGVVHILVVNQLGSFRRVIVSSVFQESDGEIKKVRGIIRLGLKGAVKIVDRSRLVQLVFSSAEIVVNLAQRESLGNLAKRSAAFANSPPP